VMVEFDAARHAMHESHDGYRLTPREGQPTSRRWLHDAWSLAPMENTTCRQFPRSPA
jgi:hypothetical protein